MLHVSLVVEILRARPLLVVALAAAAQAALWTVLPSLFYAAPPGDLPFVLAIGHEFQLGSHRGPPLAFWLADLAFEAGGMFGVYALAQACIVATYLAVFRLGAALVGGRQAALAVLLMVGVSAFAVPTPEFGPSVLATPLWALALLHYWRAVGQGRAVSWLALALDLGLLLLTSYWGLLLVGLLILFTLATARGRAALAALDPWIAMLVTAVALAPHLVWLHGHDEILRPGLVPFEGLPALQHNALAWLRLLAVLLVAHAGLLVLAVLASGWPRRRPAAPVIARPPLSPFGRGFVYAFALGPPLLGSLAAAAIGRAGIVADGGLLLVLSGLAVVTFAGDRIPLHHQRLLSLAWFGLLLIPPFAAVAGVAITPWLGTELRVTRPAEAMGRYFAETFERRTGRPLAVVTGDPQLAALVAVGAASRPALYLDDHPDRSPLVTAEDLRRRGAVVVWPARGTAGLPPPEIRARHPDLVPEVPRAFERPVQGRLPAVRVGWGVIRPQAAPVAPR